jgi:acyl-CoA synthetase (AMP-forming)/AMP-acid ligase II
LGKGPQITLGYLNYVQATRESYDEEGFLYTGDIGFFDKEKVGWLTITDRLKEMIKVGGEPSYYLSMDSTRLTAFDVYR